MGTLAPVDGALLAGIALPSLVTLLHPLFIHLARRKAERLAPPDAGPDPSISVAVPLARTEEHGEANIRRLLEQRGIRDLQAVLAAEGPDDPAVAAAVAASIEATRAGAGKGSDAIHGAMEAVFSGDPHGRIAKMHNLRAALPRLRNELVVFMDSDVALIDPLALRAVVRPLRDERVGLVTAAPMYRRPRTPGAYLLATMINADLRGYFSLLYFIGTLNVANGALIAMRRTLILEIGGFDRLQHQLLNDTILARMVRAAGRRIALSAWPATIPAPSLTLSDWWDQVMRWHVGMRGALPAAEYLLYAYHRSALGIGLVWFLARGARPEHLPFLWVPALARTVSGSCIHLLWNREPQALIEIPLAVITDLISPVVWLLSFFRSRVRWRGRTYRVLRGGQARAVERA